MKVIRARVLGFCMGVRRAVDLTNAEAEKAAISGGQVYTLGPLIHNPEVLARLENRGVRALTQPPGNLSGSSIIIRAHGISPQAEENLRAGGGRVIDATCPRVKASQLKARALVRDGFSLFLAGEAQHAEIAGILGYASSGFCAVVENAAKAEAEAAELYKRDRHAKTALIGQTTISEEEYRVIGEAVQKYFPFVEIVQTICAATKERQEALLELLEQADAVIIAGGKESANTRRLLAIAQERGKPCVLAENAAGIPEDFRGFGTIGICAGASTPDSVIEEIERELR
jgi:4-hydroxy-3-methylbut-2-enyl diphosphate reductase